MEEKIILETNFPNLKLVKKGKVRDIYDAGENYVIVSTDRLSAFDVIMQQGIPLKGKVLTKISEFWFNFSAGIIDNHLISTDVDDYPAEFKEYEEDLRGRSMLVKKAEVVPIESIVRGYISGSGWNEYKESGRICGMKIDEGLSESQKLKEPLFTPSTKAELGMHDENISHEQALKITDEDTFNTIKHAALEIYTVAAELAYSKGIIIADTKMEFGIHNNKVILVDELLTPDSSRFWPKDKYEKGRGQESYDKQYVRDYLLSINFNKRPPAPELPEEVIRRTSEKYQEALYQLTGEKIL